ncbi:LegC family aminotransferase [Octadecabacter sp.]|nr:LegC family aminotransferase [Octadecabacter sp.]
MCLSKKLIKQIRSVTGYDEQIISLHKPEFHGREKHLLSDCIDTGWVSSVGSYVDAFGAEIAKISDCQFGVPVVNGTVALQIALSLVGVSEDCEVLVPTLTFVATANAVSHLGALPHFVDSSYRTLGICPSRLRQHLEKSAQVRNGQTWNITTGRRIAAVVPMHVYGCPVDMDELTALTLEWPMAIVEDSAESVGSKYKGRACGSLGQVAAISFNGNKIITTGAGGAIVTNDEDLARRAKHITTTAKKSHRWAFIHDEIGYNFRMPNLNAALGVAQLEQLNARINQKKRLFDAYAVALSELNGVSLFETPSYSSSNNWLITLILDQDMAKDRDFLLDELNNDGLMSRPVWTLMHHLPMYNGHPKADLSHAIDLEMRVINIPSSAYLGAAL